MFTETMQIGIVVRDLDAALRTYVDDYGIGPWEIYDFNPANAKDLREYGQTVQRSWRPAVATPKFDYMMATQAKQGNNLVLSGTFSGAKVAYLPTDRDLKVIIEIFSGTPVVEEKPDGKTQHWRT
jgi:hypothetical protein